MEIPKKFCHNCGTQLLPSAKFCSSCGTSLASINEKPPTTAPKNARANLQTTFEPTVVSPSRRSRDDDDYDDSTIRADRVESLAELDINLNNLDISIDAPRAARESMASVVSQGLQMPKDYKETPRMGHVDSSLESVNRILREGAALKPGESLEIK